MNDEALALYYREESRRLGECRRAMETTRNVAAAVLAGMILVAYGLPRTNDHMVFIAGSLIVFACQLFETRTHRSAAVSSRRIALIERNGIAPMLDGSIAPEPGWRETLAASIASPPDVSFVEAFAGRVKRNYIIIFLILDTWWLTKGYLYPEPAGDWSAFVRRFDAGFVPGEFFLWFFVVYWVLYFGLAIWYSLGSPEHELPW